MRNVVFNRVEIKAGSQPASLRYEDEVPVLAMQVPSCPAVTYWRMSFDFEPPRHLTSDERGAMEAVVTRAVDAFLKSLPADPAAPRPTVSTLGFATERIVRVSPVPETAARAAEGATFTIEDDGMRYLGVPARIVDGAVEFVVSRASMRTAIEEPQG